MKMSRQTVDLFVFSQQFNIMFEWCTGLTPVHTGTWRSSRCLHACCTTYFRLRVCTPLVLHFLLRENWQCPSVPSHNASRSRRPMGAFVNSTPATPESHSLTWGKCTIPSAILVPIGLTVWYISFRRGRVTLVLGVFNQRTRHLFFSAVRCVVTSAILFFRSSSNIFALR